MTLNMPPYFSINDAGNISLRSFILSSETYQGSSWAILCANFFHLRARQFSCAIRFALGIISASFYFHVAHVIKVSSKKKMIRVYALRYVARMAYEQARRNCTKMKHPRHAMRAAFFSVKAESPVTIRVAIRNPQPVIVWSTSLNFRPETVFDFLRENSNQLLSFIHNYSMVEVRARHAASTAIALVFCNPFPGACQ